jgi:tRNA dimethylallyltransferase
MGTLLIAGTTASGKSATAIRLAKRYDAVIVSADAMTVYRGLDVGTAKPSLEEQEGVVHFGIDTHDLMDSSDVSDFITLVDQTLAAHPKVIIVGGTTFWLSALVHPLAELPPADPDLRAELSALERPHTALQALDPQAAARLHPNDKVRVVRALEVFHLTGMTQTALHALGPSRPPIDAETVWMDSDDLRERIEQRVDGMCERGYIAEVDWALGHDPKATSKPLQSFAYRHLVSANQGKISEPEALRCTARDTWQYARKQRTWARNLNWTQSPAGDIDDIAKRCFEKKSK